MREIRGNLFDQKVDAICITTNGVINKKGEGIVGRGCAKEASELFPLFAPALGKSIRVFGNVANIILPKWLVRELSNGKHEYSIWSFPTKDHWREKSDINLIKQSALELVRLTASLQYAQVVIPRPGCNNGQLEWSDVKKVLEPLLDNRFIVISP